MSDRIMFSSKVDMWLLIVVLGGVAACFAVVAQIWDSLGAARWWVGALLMPVIVLPLWVLFTTRYTMSDDELGVRCGPFHWTVPIGEITAIERTRNPMSSPALSLDRLRIEYGNGRSLMISPEPRGPFIKQLEYRRQQAA